MGAFIDRKPSLIDLVVVYGDNVRFGIMFDPEDHRFIRLGSD
jgi:hypothetical protein